MDELLGTVWGQAENKQHAYGIEKGVLIQTESICGKNVKQVTTCKREEVMKVSHEIPLAGQLGENVFSSVPGSSKVKGHSVNLMPDFVPKKLKPYCIPIALQEEVNKEINELFQLGLIEPNESEWAHLNNARYFLFEIGQARFISVLDLTKGYWQIPMKEEAKPLTAFVTHSGHYQWKKVGLKENLKKCAFGRKSVKSLGRIVGSGKHTPNPEKVETIRKLNRPTTKV
ncbi:retrovirus-related Pol polyprotein from transposon 297 [Trichonephila clavipes]|uniref:Retrovirus-related Pol polyprotein from transposon 297 n=1 Tax=Trichonephila clavipes TaxID=2585209 RepID=A0A8X6SFT7_TRICX|nr:retrovirus-related Pol polyprotein from transposon 297 [Trichonephila clavipes]